MRCSTDRQDDWAPGLDPDRTGHAGFRDADDNLEVLQELGLRL